jgi:hypothetical protein
MRTKLVTAEPAIMEVRAKDQDGTEVHRAVTTGMTIWERKEISWPCCTLSYAKKKTIDEWR